MTDKLVFGTKNNGDLFPFRSIRVNPCSSVVKILLYPW